MSNILAGDFFEGRRNKVVEVGFRALVQDIIGQTKIERALIGKRITQPEARKAASQDGNENPAGVSG